MERKYFDIKHPRQKSPTPRIVEVRADLPYIPVQKPKPRQSRRSLKIPVVATAGALLLVIIIFGFNILRFKKYATENAPAIYDQFKSGATALLNLQLGDARQSFEQASNSLEDLNKKSPIKSLPGILDNLFKLSQNAISLSATLEELKISGLGMIINKKGAFLIDHFKKLKENIANINQLSSLLGTQAKDFGHELDGDFAKAGSKLSDSENFLASLIDWLEAPKKQRLLVFFQNPSEIRPTGGFIGSYANATLFQGNLMELEVRDIYDPDGQLDIKVIPPKPLQGITDKWGARDANWFFDFPTSAQKVIEFLETSKIYSERGIKFSGAIAINVELLKDILGIIGPIELPEYKLTIGADNFLPQIQKEVEAGEDKAKGNPKRIIKLLTPIIFERLALLGDSQKGQLLEKLSERFSKKDIMVYFKDKTIENFLKNWGVGGEVVNLPENFTGEYLAVVNSNIGGGKSDAFISQKIKFESKVDGAGKIQNHLIVERSHSGQDQKEWWYRATNRNYLQIFTAPGAKLEKITGNTKKTIKPLVDYKAKGFIAGALLKEFEKPEALVFGKTLFGAWLDVKAGATGKIEMNYQSGSRLNLSGGVYQFVFEKQSGVDSSLDVTIEAPNGYRWKELGSLLFQYKAENLSSRLRITLTAEKTP